MGVDCSTVDSESQSGTGAWSLSTTGEACRIHILPKKVFSRVDMAFVDKTQTGPANQYLRVYIHTLVHFDKTRTSPHTSPSVRTITE